MNPGKKHTLPEQVSGYIRTWNLFRADQPLLLAVSGGLDSVVLCEIMNQLGRAFDIAHVNFHLRGEESDRDEDFVRALAERYGVRVWVKHADTHAYADAHKLSIQEAAREIRYQWLHELIKSLNEERDAGGTGRHRQAPGYRLLTAHHLDDNIETVLMNFFKGTGLSGIRGMLPATEAVARPLLFARKAELEAFARDSGLQWVEDSSNRESKYSRNYLRLHIIPEIERLYPSLSANMEAHISRFRSLENFVDAAVEKKLQKWILRKDGELHLPVNRLKQEPGVETLLFHLVLPFGFSPAQVSEVKHLLDAETGKQVASASHRIFRNRAWLIIAPVATDHPQTTLVESLPALVRVGNGWIDIDLISGPPSEADLQMPHVQFLDARAIGLPLLARPWKKGDYFYPLGMQKKKKLARFFIDAKLSQTEKEKQWVLLSEDRVLLVAGLRIDNRFRIEPSTPAHIRVRFRPAGP